MNLQFYVEKLKTSDVFEKFMKEHPNAYACSGFFIIDKTGKEENKQHFDFWIPENKKLMSFQVENMQLVPLEDFGKIPDRLSLEQDIEFDEIEKMIKEKMAKEGLKDKIQKMLFSLQSKNGKNFLIVTVFVPKLGLITATVDLEKMEIDKFEKKSFMDMINVFKKK
tara:strand:- start:108 stop:605 length:498 start_codon:yes stop_codon:yes gene_type:complete